MKNSKEYAKKITSLYQSLKRKYPKVTAGNYLASHKQVVDSVVYGIICEKLSEKDTESALKRFSEYFVDWNDLRVSRPEEIAEQLGADTPENRQIALTITKVLQKIFNENHQVSIESLQKTPKRQARVKLEKIEDLSRFAVDYCMLVSLGSHTIPLTEKMIEYLKMNDLVDKNADANAIEGFLSKQITARNGYEFYELLRSESELSSVVRDAYREKETQRAVRKAKSAKRNLRTKKVVKKKTKKKKTTKKKTKK